MSYMKLYGRGVARLFGVDVSKVQLSEQLGRSCLAGSRRSLRLSLLLCKRKGDELNSPAMRVSKQIPTGLPSSPKQDLPEIVGPGSRIFQKLFFLMFFVFAQKFPKNLLRKTLIT
jgi:hypothetical protein